MTGDTTIIPFRQPGSIIDPLTEIARDGARRMLMAALKAASRRLCRQVFRRPARRWPPAHRSAWRRAGAGYPDRDRADRGPAPIRARPAGGDARRGEDPLHVQHPAEMGAARDKPRCPPAGALPARHFHRRLSRGTLCPSRPRRTEPVARRDCGLTAGWQEDCDRGLAVAPEAAVGPSRQNAAQSPAGQRMAHRGSGRRSTRGSRHPPPAAGSTRFRMF